jgi:8-oxo-dGTP pyrophosphatase MutT (NUDIX family)
MQRQHCRKVIVAPFVIQNNKVYFLTVKDRTHREWTFITGGCKSNESTIQSAFRELNEETKSVVSIDFNKVTTQSFEFSTTYREPYQIARDRERGELVITNYSMFFMDVTRWNKCPLDLRNRFRRIKDARGPFNENLDITFETLDSFLGKNFVWRFIKQIVIRTPRFAELYKQINLQQWRQHPSLPSLESTSRRH